MSSLSVLAGPVPKFVDKSRHAGAYVADTIQVFPTHRRVGPGVEMRDDPVERRRRSGQELDAYTSLE